MLPFPPYRDSSFLVRVPKLSNVSSCRDGPALSQTGPLRSADEQSEPQIVRGPDRKHEREAVRDRGGQGRERELETVKKY